MKQSFFFELLSDQLKSQDVMVFQIVQARVPLLNICFKGKLWIDIALAVVHEIDNHVVNMVCEDESSEICLRSVKTSIYIHDYVKKDCKHET